MELKRYENRMIDLGAIVPDWAYVFVLQTWTREQVKGRLFMMWNGL